jgi:hypothetical protein
LFISFEFLRVVAYPIEIRKGYVLDRCLPLEANLRNNPSIYGTPLLPELASRFVKFCQL